MSRRAVPAALGAVIGVALVLAGIDGSFMVWGCVPPPGGACGGAAPWLSVYAGDLFVAGVAFMAASFGLLAYSIWGSRKR